MAAGPISILVVVAGLTTLVVGALDVLAQWAEEDRADALVGWLREQVANRSS